MRSIESPFKFLSYKVDKFEIDVKDNLSLLVSNEQHNADSWQYRLAFQQPRFFTADNIYVGGVGLDMRLLDPSDDAKEEENELLRVNAAISGAFQTEKGAIPHEAEERLVKNHIPAILFPYLRSTISSFLANAGYGSIVLPLININAMAEEASAEMEILRITPDTD